MNYIDLTNKLVQKCLDRGAGSAEVYLENSRQLSIRVQDGEIETIEEASSAGAGFRVIVDGKIGFSHCNDLTDKSLDETLGRAIEFARLTSPDENNVLPVDPTLATVKDLYDPEIPKTPMEEKIAMAIELEALAKAQPGITKSSGASYGENETEIFIANSNGISKTSKSSGCFLGVDILAEKGEQKSPGFEGCTRVFIADLKPIKELAESAAKKAVELLDPVQVPTQKAAVIFDREAAGSLLGGVIEALSGDQVNQGASFLKDSMDKPFASDLLTIIDDGTLARKIASAPFEGTTTQRTVLVEKGLVRNFIYNTTSAKRAGKKSTGHAARRGYSSLPGISTYNIIVEPGTDTPEQIIAGTTKGLLVKEVTGYGIDPVTGNFSGGATGLWIENGKIVHPVSGLTIAGSAEEILWGIDKMGNDIDREQSFACPSFRIREMQIGGNKS
jgi:PmbA protein